MYYADHRILGLYTLVHGRLARFEEVQRTLDAAAVQYYSAMGLEEKRHIAANLVAIIRHQLEIGDALISEESGLLTLRACLDQFSVGENICEFTLAAAEGLPPRRP